MITATIFLVLAIVLFHQSLRILKNGVFSPKQENISRLLHYTQRVANLLALLLWFIAGTIAFVASISDYASYVILNLQ